MSNDHVGIPRFLEDGFAINGYIAYFNFKSNKMLRTKAEKLGVENDYYDSQVEHGLLSDNLEKRFADFYHSFLSSDSRSFQQKIADNRELIMQFFRFMFFRSKKILDIVNQESKSSKTIGNMSHSEFLIIESFCKASPTDMLGKDFDVVAAINRSERSFINNSLGFSIYSYDKKANFFIPFNGKIGLGIKRKDIDFSNKDFGYLDSEGVSQMNRFALITEMKIGNGFIFGEREEEIKEVLKLAGIL